MISINPCFIWIVAAMFLADAVFSQSDDKESKAHPSAATIPQQQQAEQAQKSQQQSPLLQPDFDSFQLYNAFPIAEDDSGDILLPYGEEENDDDEDSLLDEPNVFEKRYHNRFVGKRFQNRFVGKRYTPRFVGKRYTPRFVGKRYTPRFVGKRFENRFVGKRYTPRFVGKRYHNRFVGKRYTPRFVGKRSVSTFQEGEAPRFVGKREAERTDNEVVAHSIEKREAGAQSAEAPRFVGKRAAEKTNSEVISHSIEKRQAGVYSGRGLTLAGLMLGDNDSDFGDAGDFYGKDESESGGCSENGIGKRQAPRFVGKRQAPRFVGKRYVDIPLYLQRRQAPRFVGKRDDDELTDYLIRSEILNDIYSKRSFPGPRFVGKKSVFNEFRKRNLPESDVQSLLDNWSRQKAIMKLAANDKRWGSPVEPNFIGKRMENDDLYR